MAKVEEKTCPKCDGPVAENETATGGRHYQCKYLNCLHSWTIEADGKQAPTGAPFTGEVNKQIEDLKQEIEHKAQEHVASGAVNKENTVEARAVTKLAGKSCDLCGQAGFKTGQAVGSHKRHNCPKMGGKPPAAKPKKELKMSTVDIHSAKNFAAGLDPVGQAVKMLKDERGKIIQAFIRGNPELAKIDNAIKALEGNGNPT